MPSSNHSHPVIWVIDDDIALRTILQDTLTDEGFEVQTFGQATLAWQTLTQLTTEAAPLPSVIITDIRMPVMDGLSFSEKIRTSLPQIPVIIMTAHADVQSAVDSYQTGAFDYLPKPFDLDDAITVVQKALSQSQLARQTMPDINALNTPPSPEPPSSMTGSSELQPNGHTKLIKKSNTTAKQKNINPSGIIGQSVAMQKVFRAIGRLSHVPITVLITGESGTGKELIAQALHDHSPRKNKAFIALNMAAIPHDLIESELFGHEKGAFTGATTTRPGRFEQAHGGTLFLDEIGDMPLSTQTRLLRVLANGEFFRVGGQKPVKVDVRIIAATHQHLEALVKQGKFREDLFYRLNVIRLSLPALRERREDIPLLVEFFMQTLAHSMDMPTKRIAPNTMQLLQRYDWQGNVRQLENACRWLLVMATGQQVQPSDLPPEILAFYEDGLDSKPTHTASSLDDSLTSQLRPNADFNSSIPNQTLPQAINTPSLAEPTADNPQILTADDWLTPLRSWAHNALQNGQQGILQIATQDFERCLLEVALQFTQQHKGQAADLLGWGRNTVTRKYQQLLKTHDR